MKPSPVLAFLSLAALAFGAQAEPAAPLVLPRQPDGDGRIALHFVREEKIPFAEMTSANALIGNPKDNNDKFCFAKAGELYLVCLPEGGGTKLEVEGPYTLQWFNPRDGSKGDVSTFTGELAAPDDDDWLAVIKKAEIAR